MGSIVEETRVPSVDARKDCYPSRRSDGESLRPRHDPVVYSDDPAAGPIDAALVERYRERGFLVLDGLFSGPEVQCLQDELNRLRQDGPALRSDEAITESDSGALRSLFRVHTSSAVFRRLASDARLVRLAQYLLGDEAARSHPHRKRVHRQRGNADHVSPGTPF